MTSQTYLLGNAKGEHTDISVSPDQYLPTPACLPVQQASLSVVFDFVVVVSLGRSLGAASALFALNHAPCVYLCHHLPSGKAWNQWSSIPRLPLDDRINVLLILRLAHVVKHELKLGAFLAKDLETIDCGDILHRALLRVQLRIGL
jgi:hypothetical protein